MRSTWRSRCTSTGARQQSSPWSLSRTAAMRRILDNTDAGTTSTSQLDLPSIDATIDFTLCVVKEIVNAVT